MKLGIVGDVHLSKTSSIVRSFGSKYSTRLENILDSVNWAEEILKDCDEIIYLGDFFDTPNLDAQEITAFTEIKWNDKPHTMLVGNHDMGSSDLSISSMHLFNLIPNFTLITKPTVKENILFLPYILEENRKPLKDYLGKAKIVFSHNDIKGIQMGQFLSQTGFETKEIEKLTDIFINGHIHNCGKFSNGKGINLGNLTGQNFNEDATKYNHSVMILDTETLEYELVENPHAFNFYKLTKIKDIENIKNNAVVTLKVKSSEAQKGKEALEDKRIVASRLMLEPDTTGALENLELQEELIQINHLEEFNKYIVNELGKDKLVLEEIQEVLR